MIDPVCSLLNLLLSVERHWWTNVAEPNAELLISKNDYDARIDELKAAGSAILWNLSNNMRTHHWSAVMHIGATAFQDFGNRKLLTLTDHIKYTIDRELYIPIYDYATGMPSDNHINKLVLTGPIKWQEIITEPNGFKTSLFVATVKYAQTGYL